MNLYLQIKDGRGGGIPQKHFTSEATLMSGYNLLSIKVHSTVPSTVHSAVFSTVYSTVYTGPVMSKYHKIDINQYPNIFGCHNMYQKKIRIYSDATYLLNKYPNIFVHLYKYHEYEYKKYSRVIFFEYLNIRTHP